VIAPRRYKRDLRGRFARVAGSRVATRSSLPARRPPRPKGPPADVKLQLGHRSVAVTAEKRLPVARGRVQLTAQGGVKAELVKR